MLLKHSSQRKTNSLLLYLYFLNASSMHLMHINFDSKALISFQNASFKVSLKALTSFYSIFCKNTSTPVSQSEIHPDTSACIAWNLIAESRTCYQKFPAAPSRKISTLESSWNAKITQFEVLHLCSLSNLYTPLTYCTLVFLTKLEIRIYGRSSYLLLFSSRMQEIKNT